MASFVGKNFLMPYQRLQEPRFEAATPIDCACSTSLAIHPS